MKILTLLVLIALPAHAQVELASIEVESGAEIQICTRYPDPILFPGKRPAMMIIQGSGMHDTCLRLERQWATDLINKGVVVFGRQKRGIKVDPKTREVQIDRLAYAKNTVDSLKGDSVQAFSSLIANILVDPNRIGVVGGSEGTWMATAIGLAYPHVKRIELVGAPIERLDLSFERQFSSLIPSEIMSSYDKDFSGTLSASELSEEMLQQSALLSFDDIDVNSDKEISTHELAAELRRAVTYSLASGDDIFLLSDLGGGISAAWLKSAILTPPLGPEILQLKMPVGVHHGTLDVNTSIRAVRKLESRARNLGLENIQFSYYEGLGHELSKEIIIHILNSLADAVSDIDL